ncbi:hypothetical protein HY990_03480 [Candidatus Micrarchaeota archaeon]|nr:hypothetical protein [Candidatus Micrarchaeota archaeon]
MASTSLRKNQIETAQKALLAGARHVRTLFGRSMTELGVEYKPKDGDTPRTIIDRESEGAILKVLHNAASFKGYAISAEEAGAVTSGISGRVWIDPFDGTSNAAIRLKMSTLGICVTEPQTDGTVRTVLGVIVQPFEMLMTYAAVGEGAFSVDLAVEADGRFYTNSDPRRLERRIMSKPNERFVWIDGLFNDKTSQRKGGWLTDISELAQNVRSGGSNIDYSLKLANGQGDIQLTDAIGGHFDLSGIPIIREFGGRFMDLDAKEPQPGCHIAIACLDPTIADRLLEITNNHYGKSSRLGAYKGFR